MSCQEHPVGIDRVRLHSLPWDGAEGHVEREREGREGGKGEGGREGGREGGKGGRERGREGEREGEKHGLDIGQYCS